MRDGNIGGILSRTTSAGAAFYGYDGNGNVSLLTNSAGQDVGHYRYDALGQTPEAVGPRAGENPYRFSTKEFHAQSGLYDYGFRFYSPGMGRWLNRDPLGEDGGINLYAMVGNNPVNDVDAYGLSPLLGGGWLSFFRAFGRLGRIGLLENAGRLKVSPPRPTGARNEATKNAIEQIYKGDKTSKPIGRGSTGDAIRRESRTGQPAGGRGKKWHWQKGVDMLKHLKDLSKNKNIPKSDRQILRRMKNDLQQAVEEGKPHHPKSPNFENLVPLPTVPTVASVPTSPPDDNYCRNGDNFSWCN